MERWLDGVGAWYRTVERERTTSVRARVLYYAVVWGAVVFMAGIVLVALETSWIVRAFGH